MMIRTIGVLTSGGDAPGMNAAIRAVARAGLERGLRVMGVREGYAGLVTPAFTPLDARTVGGIIQRGGTVLGSSRCVEFREDAGRRRAARERERAEIEALVVIGGNGSQAGAAALARLGVPLVGIASTIDNDVCGVDMTLGVDTALNVALEAIDRLKVTAASHRRVSLVEVMGRDCGYLALAAGVAGGAEAIVIPEMESTPEDVEAKVAAAYARGQRHALVVIAEGARHGLATIKQHLEQVVDGPLRYDVRATILGHVQRGGTPGAFDRLLGSRLGAAAVAELAEGRRARVVGLAGGHVMALPLDEVAGRHKALDPSLLELKRVLTR